jgi:hypothetical protein
MSGGAADVEGPDPICCADIYPRYPPGEYQVLCLTATTYQDPRFRCWKCRLECQFLTEREKVSGFLNLGDGQKPNAGRGSEYRRVWVMANGAQPRRRQVLSKRIFIGKVFRVLIDDTRRKHDGREHIPAERYSTIKEFLARIGP